MKTFLNMFISFQFVFLESSFWKANSIDGLFISASGFWLADASKKLKQKELDPVWYMFSRKRFSEKMH